MAPPQAGHARYAPRRSLMTATLVYACRMRVHHLNCATMCPPFVGKMVCHVLAVETPADGVVLVDTGLGSADVATPRQRLGREFVAITRPTLDAAETALAQLARLGFAARDVRHIVVTHLD